MDYTHRCDSPIGGITLASDGTALTGLWFDGQRHYAETLSADHEARDLPVFEAAERWLSLYFGGVDPGFTPPLDPRGMPFRRAVWQALLSVPYGQTVTYAQVADAVARQAGRPRPSARAVGGAVARNPISLIIPCHRVVGAGGGLTGYAGGLERKAWLLELERSGRRA